MCVGICVLRPVTASESEQWTRDVTIIYPGSVKLPRYPFENVHSSWQGLAEKLDCDGTAVWNLETNDDPGGWYGTETFGVSWDISS